MMVTPHLLVGGACGLIFNNPILAFGSGILSHLILDLVPHHDQRDYLDYQKHAKAIVAIGITDFSLGFFLLWSAVHGKTFDLIFTVFLGALGGIVIDLFDDAIGDFIYPKFRRTVIGSFIHKFHDYFHYNRHNHWLIGISTQIIATLGGWAVIYLM